MADRPGASAGEQRQAPRHRTVKFAWYKALDEGVEIEGVAHSCDLSRGGIGLYVSHELPSNAKVFVEVSTGEFSLSAVGKVAHVRKAKEGYFRIGISFVVVPPNDRILLDRLFRTEE